MIKCLNYKHHIKPNNIILFYDYNEIVMILCISCLLLLYYIVINQNISVSNCFCSISSTKFLFLNSMRTDSDQKIVNRQQETNVKRNTNVAPECHACSPNGVPKSTKNNKPQTEDPKFPKRA